MLRTCWPNKLAQTGPESLTQPPITPDVSLVDDAVITKHGCLMITRMMALLTPELSSRLTQFYLVWPACTEAGSYTARQPRPAATNQGPCPHFQFSQLHTRVSTHWELRLTTPAQHRGLRVLGTPCLTPPAKLKITR